MSAKQQNSLFHLILLLDYTIREVQESNSSSSSSRSSNNNNNLLHNTHFPHTS